VRLPTTEITLVEPLWTSRKVIHIELDGLELDLYV